MRGASPNCRVWYGGLNAIGYAEHYSRSHNAVIRVYDAAGTVIETHQHNRRVQKAVSFLIALSTNLF